MVSARKKQTAWTTSETVEPIGRSEAGCADHAALLCGDPPDETSVLCAVVVIGGYAHFFWQTPRDEDGSAP